jgi:hypothetical protein
MHGDEPIEVRTDGCWLVQSRWKQVRLIPTLRSSRRTEREVARPRVPRQKVSADIERDAIIDRRIENARNPRRQIGAHVPGSELRARRCVIAAEYRARRHGKMHVRINQTGHHESTTAVELRQVGRVRSNLGSNAEDAARFF